VHLYSISVRRIKDIRKLSDIPVISMPRQIPVSVTSAERVIPMCIVSSAEALLPVCFVTSDESAIPVCIVISDEYAIPVSIVERAMSLQFLWVLESAIRL
jgi:hypothetical protein